MDLKKCSTAKEGESSKSMEVSPAVATSSMTKRKAETEPEPVEEESDSEEEKAFAAKAYMTRSTIRNNEIVYTDSSSGPEHRLIKPDWWKAPEWGVDSFDDEPEYDSADEAKASTNTFSDEDTQKQYCRFRRQLLGNRGFYVEPELASFHPWVGMRAVDDLEGDAGDDQTFREYFTEMAHLCLKKYKKKHGFDVEFVQVVRGAYTLGSRSKSYITFMAKEKPDGPLVEYQCKVWCTFQVGQNFPILCRPAPLVKKL